MKNRFRISRPTNIREIAELPHVLQLQVFLSFLLSSLRWYGATREDPSELGAMDRLTAVVMAAGWTGEILEFISRHPSIFRREDTEADPASLTTWNECFGEPRIPLVDRISAIRNRCFAHYDLRVTRSAVELIAQNKLPPLFMEWNEKMNSDARASMAFIAITHDVFGAMDKSVMIENARSLGDGILKIGLMTDYLLAGVLKRLGIEFEPC